jgi:hypothetical protein
VHNDSSHWAVGVTSQIVSNGTLRSMFTSNDVTTVVAFAKSTSQGSDA